MTARSRVQQPQRSNSRPRIRLAVALFGPLTLLLALGDASEAYGQCVTCPGSFDSFMCTVPVQLCRGTRVNPDPSNPPECAGPGCGFVVNCRNPSVSEPTFEIFEQANGKFTARLGFTVTAPWNQVAADDLSPEYNPNGTLDMLWFGRPTAPLPCEPTGGVSTCEYFASDRAECYLQRTDLTCQGAPYSFGVFSFRA